MDIVIQDAILYAFGIICALALVVVLYNIITTIGYGDCVKTTENDVKKLIDMINDEDITEGEVVIRMSSECMDGVVIGKKPTMGEYMKIEGCYEEDKEGTFLIIYPKGAGFFDYVSEASKVDIKGVFQLYKRGNHKCKFIDYSMQLAGMNRAEITDNIKIYDLKNTIFLMAGRDDDDINSFCIKFSKANSMNAFSITSINEGMCIGD